MVLSKWENLEKLDITCVLFKEQKFDRIHILYFNKLIKSVFLGRTSFLLFVFLIFLILLLFFFRKLVILFFDFRFFPMIDNKRGMCVQFFLNFLNIIGLRCNSLNKIDFILLSHFSGTSDELLYLINCESISP